MSLDELMEQLEEVGRFESLVHLPLKRDPDWPKWAARATRKEISFTGKGETGLQAMHNLLKELTGEN